MKQLSTFFILLFALALSAQTQQVTLHMKQLLDNQPFALNSEVTLTPTKKHFVTRTQYYLSEIKVIHDGGQEALIAGLHLLIDASKDSIFSLGEVAATNVEGIQFSIGVDAAFNHLDPAKYPAGDPLGPQIPDMHWGWAAGYRFLVLEGNAQNANGLFVDHYELHALGDALYKTVTILTPGDLQSDGFHIRLKADYNALLNNLNTTGGLIVHGSTGAALTFMKNAETSVFSAETTTQTSDFQPVVSLVVGPNPAISELHFNYEFDVKTAIALTVLDNSGKQVFHADKLETSGEYILPTGQWSGSFVYRFSTENVLIDAGSFQVIR